MSSGFGAKGGVGRCYPVWRELSACMSSTADPRECRAKGEDYFECLHHKKEYTRYNKMASELARRRSAGDTLLMDQKEQ